MDNIRPIQNEADYTWALAEVEPYFASEPEPGSPAGDRFAVLLDLIEAYESKAWRIETPDPIETIKAYMETFSKSQTDLAALLGSRSRASEILSRHRGLSVDMIHKLNVEWRIPADLMVVPYHLKTRKKRAA